MGWPVIVEGVLAIKRVFSLVGQDNKFEAFKLSKCLYNGKTQDYMYGSKLYSLNIQIRSKAVYILKAAETCNFR